MRILLLCPFEPDLAASHGGGVYVATLARALAARASLGLVALQRPEDCGRAIEHPTTYRFRACVPIPRPASLAGRVVHRARMVWRWRRQPLVAAKAWRPELAEAIGAARREFQPDVALVEMAQMAQYLPYLQGLPTVLTDHEAGCPANTHTGLGSLGDRRDRRLWSRFVAHYYPMASLVQAVTPEDAEVLRQRLGRAVAVRPPVVPVPAAPVSPGSAPPRALFLGDYRHGPNPEAATRLAHEVLPQLRAACPDAELWLAGPHGERLAGLAHLPGVRVLGFVPDLGALFGQVRLLLAPLFSGAGFRVKSAVALAHGLPVVTNRLGARGLDAPAPARTIAETAAGLSQHALALLRDPDAAAAAGAAAYAWAQQHLSDEAVGRLQYDRLAALCSEGPGAAALR